MARGKAIRRTGSADCPEKNDKGQECVRTQSDHKRHWPAGAGGETWTDKGTTGKS